MPCMCGEQHSALDKYRRWLRDKTIYIDETELLLARQEAERCRKLQDRWDVV